MVMSAGIAALEDVDLVCVHVEAPDEASHEGRGDEKIKALEQIDQVEYLTMGPAHRGHWVVAGKNFVGQQPTHIVPEEDVELGKPQEEIAIASSTGGPRSGTHSRAPLPTTSYCWPERATKPTRSAAPRSCPSTSAS